jgi:glycosyltransferase involved in cell wall biosynthesis
MPFVSAVIPTHNRPAMLAEALASVRAQTFTDYEIIVVSNGENTETRDRSRQAAEMAGAQWFALDAGNLSAARNFGVEQAAGEWIAFLDDDDLWLPCKLERQVAEAQRSGADLITSDWTSFFPDGTEEAVRPRVLPGWTRLKAISCLHWVWVPSAVMMRTRTIVDAGGFDVCQRFGEDADMWRRAMLHGAAVSHIEQALVRYRRGHADAMNNQYSNRIKLLYALRFQAKAFLNTPRAEGPTISSFLMNLGEFCAPRLLPAIGRTLRPRTRLLQLRQWMQASPT